MSKKVFKIFNTLIFAGMASGLWASSISSDFSGSTSNLTLPYTDANDATNNGNRSVSRNQFNWTESNATDFSLRGLDSLVMGDYTWGSAGTPISAGRIFTTLAGGQYNDGTGGGGNTSNIRATGTSDPTRARIQVNDGDVGETGTLSPADLSVWNLVVEFGGASNFEGLSFSFRAGTAQTSGAWDNNSIANNGNYNIRLTPVSVTGNNGVLGGSPITAFGTPQAIGAGAGPTMTPTWNTGSINPGVYLLQLEFSDQGGQRSSLGDFSVTAIPEPGILVLVGVAMGVLVVFRRRK